MLNPSVPIKQDENIHMSEELKRLSDDYCLGQYKELEKDLENYLVFLEGARLKSDILKIGHHGSNKSISESLLGFVSPQYAVIFVGKDNSYGHPHKETLDILEKFEIPVLRTDESGMIKITSDSENIFITN